MFTRFKQAEGGLPIYIRDARVQAFARVEEGGTRIFLGGSLSCLVEEDEETVRERLKGDPEADR